MQNNFINLVFVVFVSVSIIACGGGGGSSDSDSSEEIDTAKVSAECGIIRNTELEAQLDSHELEQVTVKVVEPDKLIITRTSADKAINEQLVKILAISSKSVSPKARLQGIELVENLTRPYGYLLAPHSESEVYTDPNGEQGIYAQLFSSSGESIAEELVMRGYATPEVNGLFSDQLVGCYQSLPLLADTSQKFRTTCGAINAGTLINPIRGSQLDLVSIELYSPDFMVGTFLEGTNAGKTIGIKLHGVTSEGVSDFLIQEGMSRAKQLVGSQAYVLRSGQDCIYTSPSGGQAELAQVFSVEGFSLTEELIALGAVVPSNNGCNAEQLINCYSEIEVEAPEPPQQEQPGEIDGNPEDVFTDTEIDDFLWKPVSESTGSLVILVNVYNARVRVIGKITEDLIFTGPSNGRGTTARARNPGCAFGRNVEVQFFDTEGNRILLKDGRKSVTIENGCNRVEFRL
ncbi:MAG: hypothetical protein KDD62_01575 [Bdellovibrionales bacterium]|nr:hypothetical protein [Bdellovibrionales bacterium]